MMSISKITNWHQTPKLRVSASELTNHGTELIIDGPVVVTVAFTVVRQYLGLIITKVAVLGTSVV